MSCCVDRCWQSSRRKICISFLDLCWLTWSSWVAWTMTLQSIFDCSSTGKLSGASWLMGTISFSCSFFSSLVTRVTIVDSLHMCAKWQMTPESYARSRWRWSLESFHLQCLSRSERWFLQHIDSSIACTRSELKKIFSPMSDLLRLTSSIDSLDGSIEQAPANHFSTLIYEQERYDHQETRSTVMFIPHTTVPFSRRIARSLSTVNSQYWQMLSFGFFWIDCWDQMLVEQCSIEPHSRELLSDEHQYDGPHVQRLRPRATIKHAQRCRANERS